MKKNYLKFIALIIYYLFLYGTIVINSLLFSKISLIILLPIFIIFGFFVYAKLLSEKKQSKLIQHPITTTMKVFVISFLIIFPLVQYFVFESFMIGHTESIVLNDFIPSGQLAFLPSIFITLIFTLASFIYLLVRRAIKKLK